MSTSVQSPLQQLHHSHNFVEFTSFADVELVDTFGEVAAEYASMHTRCGLFDMPHRGVLVATGIDRCAFLNNLLTNQLVDPSTKLSLEIGKGVSAFMLNLKGRIVAEMNLVQCADRLLIEADQRLVPALATLFSRYIFSEKVQFEVATGSFSVLSLIGPGSGDILRHALGVEPSAWPMNSVEGLINGVKVVAVRSNLGVTAAQTLIINRAAAGAVYQTLVDHFADEGQESNKRRLRRVGWASYNAVRIEAGEPILGIDYEPSEPSVLGKKKEEPTSPAPENKGILPAETGRLDRYVDFKKGCYLGQEVVARMHARGQIARRLVGLKFNDDALPIAGAPVLNADDLQVGIVTSSTLSPVLSNVAIAIAMVKKPHFEVGSQLRVPAEGKLRACQVVTTPFNSRDKNGSPTKTQAADQSTKI